MPEPKQKLSRSRNRKRKGSQKITKIQLSICPKCRTKHLPHHVCQVCGTYKGREVLETATKVTKKIKNKK
ncbi:MAG TPA: 50S ribosomal protein L32 [Patescibacteria group bacterium]|nr:50S ribosomal protein L32 [Patescibacteria group bacterium]